MQSIIDLNAPSLDRFLSEDTYNAIRQTANRISYKDGTLIHGRGDDKPSLSLVNSGAVRMCMTGADGAEITLSIFGPGQTFGEHAAFAGLPRSHDVIAVGETQIDHISAASLRSLCDQYNDLAQAFMIMFSIRTFIMTEFMDDMRRLPLTVRTAKLLLQIVGVSGSRQTIHGRQSELAQTLGVSRVSIGKSLKQLESSGYIRLGYGEVDIVDVKVLQKYIRDNSPAEPLTFGLAEAVEKLTR